MGSGWRGGGCPGVSPQSRYTPSLCLSQIRAGQTIDGDGLLARMLADPITFPRKQTRVVALILPTQDLRHSVCYDLLKDGKNMAELELES